MNLLDKFIDAYAMDDAEDHDAAGAGRTAPDALGDAPTTSPLRKHDLSLVEVAGWKPLD